MHTLFRKLFPLALGLALVPALSFADSDLHMKTDGSIVATNILVYQKAGTNLFCRATWGSAFFRFVLLNATSTTIIKGHGEKATIDDIKEQDIISLTGRLSQGADSLVIVASTIQDGSLQQSDKVVSGVITSVDYSAQTFTLTDKALGKITVSVSGLDIKKGARTVSVGELKVGDKVLVASGNFDYTTHTLTATQAEVYQDKTVFAQRNFEGTLKSISGTTLPITAVVTVGSNDYTAYLAQGSAILNNAKKPTTLSRFVIGDKVRLFGSIRPTDLYSIDADTLRDLNF